MPLVYIKYVAIIFNITHIPEVALIYFKFTKPHFRLGKESARYAVRETQRLSPFSNPDKTSDTVYSITLLHNNAAIC